jgi:hypothetical protein
VKVSAHVTPGHILEIVSKFGHSCDAQVSEEHLDGEDGFKEAWVLTAQSPPTCFIPIKIKNKKSWLFSYYSP